MKKFILKWVCGECRHVCLWCRFKKECDLCLKTEIVEEKIYQCECNFYNGLENPCLDCDNYNECKSNGVCVDENK